MVRRRYNAVEKLSAGVIKAQCRYDVHSTDVHSHSETAPPRETRKQRDAPTTKVRA